MALFLISIFLFTGCAPDLREIDYITMQERLTEAEMGEEVNGSEEEDLDKLADLMNDEVG